MIGDKMVIKTNNQPREIVYGFDLTPKERKEFDYHDDLDCVTFFRYKGQVYDLGEFTRIVPAGGNGGPFATYDHSGDLKGWHGVAPDSYFSGTLVKIVDDGDRVIVGSYYS